jgi:hypothetical protein
MKNIKLVVAIILTFAFVACGNKDTKNTENGLVVGGLYTSQNKDGSYGVTKIIALDEFAVHVRMYSNKFDAKPTKEIDAKELKSFIGHAPMAKEGFLLDKPELLKVEKVAKNELEGYRLYLQQ